LTVQGDTIRTFDSSDWGERAFCGTCRRQGGVGFALMVKAGALTVQGDTIRTFDSSDWGERAFCGTCGTALWFHAKGADEYALSPGLLDDWTGLRIADEIFIDQKPDTYDFAGNRPRLTGDEFFATLSAGGQP
ncbi:GFA family protein, partial [Falsirhodobacter sp. 20TX0035]|uniref:GFA family protein n=1 Tax=Falsirhodobacter sp. 20TX0035 TaxID=3022019 RepID=UPI00232DC966